MADHKTIAAAGLAATGAGLAATGTAAATESIVVDDFDAWPDANALAEDTGAGALANDDGEVEDGALRLEYDGAGWFLSVVRADLSEHDELQLVVRGDEGGEETDVRLEIDDVEGPLSELSEDSIGTEFAPVSVDLEAAGVDTGSVQDLWLSFWQGDSGAIEIEEIRFVGDDAEECTDGIELGDHCARDTTDSGLHNDITGDGSTSHDDVTTFFEQVNSDAVQENPDAFAFAGDEENVGFNDVLALFEKL